MGFSAVCRRWNKVKFVWMLHRIFLRKRYNLKLKLQKFFKMILEEYWNLYDYCMFKYII
jgi:hypothetical protein